MCPSGARDSLLFKNIIYYLECGYYREIVKNNEGKFEVEFKRCY